MLLPKSLLWAPTHSSQPSYPSFREVKPSIPLHCRRRRPYALFRQPNFSSRLLLRESSDLLLAEEILFNWIRYELCEEANHFQPCDDYLFSSFLQQQASIPALCGTDGHWQVSKAKELRKEKDSLDQRIHNNSATRKSLLHRAAPLDYKIRDLKVVFYT